MNLATVALRRREWVQAIEYLTQSQELCTQIGAEEFLAEAYRQLEEIQTLRDTLEGLIETYDILNDPEMMDKIRRSEEDIVADRYVTLKELKAELDIS